MSMTDVLTMAILYKSRQRKPELATRSDPQAKSLGEYLRVRVLDIPEALLG